MPFNGTGTFNRVYNWTNDKANGINITASRFDTEDGGFATGLSNCLCKDGQQTATAMIPFAQGLSIPQGTSLLPTMVIIGDTTTGFYQNASGAISFTSEAVRTVTFNSNGLDNTVIGGGTPAAASFTTLSTTAGITGANSITLGTNGGTIGSLVLKGSTSGSTTIIPNVAASGTLTLPAATDTLIAKATTDTLTNKTYDTGGTGNTFKINGTTINAISGNTSKLATTTGTLNSGHIATFDGSGNIQDGGSPSATGASQVLIATSTASSAAALAFTSIPASYDALFFVIENFNPASSGQPLLMQVSINNGSSYIAGTNYIVQTFSLYSTTTVTQNTGFNGFIIINTQASTTSAVGAGTGYLMNYQANKGSNSSLTCNANRYDGSHYLTDVNGGQVTPGGTINAIQFISGSGNLTTLSVSLYGIRNS